MISTPNLNSKIIISTNENNFANVEMLLHKILPSINVKKVENDYSIANVIMAQPGKLKEILAVAKSIFTPFLIIFSYEDTVLSQDIPIDFRRITYGFSPEADFFASDESITDEGFNFKLNHKGSTVPIWVKKPFSRDEIYAVLSFVCIASILGFNIIEISEVF